MNRKTIENQRYREISIFPDTVKVLMAKKERWLYISITPASTE